MKTFITALIFVAGASVVMGTTVRSPQEFQYRRCCPEPLVGEPIHGDPVESADGVKIVIPPTLLEKGDVSINVGLHNRTYTVAVPCGSTNLAEASIRER